MNVFTVSFFGHRDFSEHYIYENKVVEIIKEIIRTKEYVEFLVGRNGEFDVFAASCVRRAKQELFDANSSLILYLPYLSAEYEDNKEYFDNFYDEVYVCEKSSSAHYKAAIQIRNKEIVDQSDLVICFIRNKSGGAYKTVEYALKQGKKVVNLVWCEK